MKFWWDFFQQILMKKSFLVLLLIINVLGTVYGYIWYGYQLADTEPKFLIFVPDSPTATLFFSFVLIAWIVGTHFKTMEALAVLTLFKYGIWAVVMNIWMLVVVGDIGMAGWMLIGSHGLMAIQGILYWKQYRFRFIHFAIAAVWTLHNDVIDYVFGQMPRYSSLSDYFYSIAYFTFWLSIVSIFVTFIIYKKTEKLKIDTKHTTLIER